MIRGSPVPRCPPSLVLRPWRSEVEPEPPELLVRESSVYMMHQNSFTKRPTRPSRRNKGLSRRSLSMLYLYPVLGPSPVQKLHDPSLPIAPRNEVGLRKHSPPPDRPVQQCLVNRQHTRYLPSQTTRPPPRSPHRPAWVRIHSHLRPCLLLSPSERSVRVERPPRLPSPLSMRRMKID